MSLSQTPIFNLKAVLNETGLAADTLRAWERRYGLPMPQRSPGGHRLYSERDIHLIRWLLARQAEGLSISRAVSRWNSLVAAGEDPLADSGTTRSAPLTGEASLAALQQSWLMACLEFDEPKAEQVLSQAFAVQPIETVVTGVILQSLREVGDLWQQGRATVQQEHFVSALATRRLDALVAAAAAPHRRVAVVLACPPAELHSLPLLYLTLLLRRQGRNAVFLGADVPIDHLVDTSHKLKAGLVLLSAQRLTTSIHLKHAAGALMDGGLRVGYGGAVFNALPALREQFPGHFLGERVDQCLGHIEEALAGYSVPPLPRRRSLNAEARTFRSARSAIEAALHDRLKMSGEHEADLAIANSYFGSAVEAALELGDIEYLAADMPGIRFLLARPHLPLRTARRYLDAYASSVRKVMGSNGSQVVRWLEVNAELQGKAAA